MRISGTRPFSELIKKKIASRIIEVSDNGGSTVLQSLLHASSNDVNSYNLHTHSMLQLPCHLLLVPPLCSRCALANISPFKEGSYRHSSWTREAVSVFSNFASMDSVKMKVSSGMY